MKKATARQGKPIPFYKLHGAGNDILVVQSKDLPKTPKASFFQRMAHRRLGIGCDQIMEVLSLKPLSAQVWNSDGSKAEMCANGGRVFLFLAALKGWISKGKTKEIPIKISGKAYKGVKMGKNFGLCLGEPKLFGCQEIAVLGATVAFENVSVGNPHAVIFLEEAKLPNYSLEKYGPLVETHSHFPDRTNVHFVRSYEKRGSKAYAEVEVWERGAGATLSCGSGAVAVAAVLQKRTGVNVIQVKMTDFLLDVKFQGKEAYLSGPSVLVAEGKYFR